MPTATRKAPRRPRGRPAIPQEIVEVAVDDLNIKRVPALSLPGACSYLGDLSQVYVRRLAAEGVIPSIKIGRRLVFLVSDLDAFLAERRRVAS
jgi:excisionase family DNA binding protein